MLIAADFNQILVFILKKVQFTALSGEESMF